MGKTVVVGLSGGVDSAVSAWLLKEQGYTVVGLFMKNWEDDDTSEYCSSRQDWLDAVSVADVLGIDIEAVNFAAEYKERVFAIFLEEYAAGRTPNPDILCNSEIKFKAFLDHAKALGADHMATGHYARVRQVDVGADGRFEPRFELLKALDASKDQSYFLHRLNQNQLSHTLFPLGHLHKTEVRRIAQSLGLPNAHKKDSTGICFIGERPFREFLNRYLPTQPGPMVDDQGRQVGQHLGLSFYTLGQRKGLQIGGQAVGNGQPWFVARKCVATNTLHVVQGHEHPWLHCTRLHTVDAHYIVGKGPGGGEGAGSLALHCKTRYRQADAACTWQAGAGGGQGQGFTLQFQEPQFAVTPGQSAVLYQGEVCLGGGVIAGMAIDMAPRSSTSALSQLPK